MTFKFAAYLAGEGAGDDNARVTVSFADDQKQEIGSTIIGPVTPKHREKQTISVLRRAIGPVPARARTSTVTLELEKEYGSRVTASADDIGLVQHGLLPEQRTHTWQHSIPDDPP